VSATDVARGRELAHEAVAQAARDAATPLGPDDAEDVIRLYGSDDMPGVVRESFERHVRLALIGEERAQ